MPVRSKPKDEVVPIEEGRKGRSTAACVPSQIRNPPLCAAGQFAAGLHLNARMTSSLSRLKETCCRPMSLPSLGTLLRVIESL